MWCGCVLLLARGGVGGMTSRAMRAPMPTPDCVIPDYQKTTVPLGRTRLAGTDTPWSRSESGRVLSCKLASLVVQGDCRFALQCNGRPVCYLACVPVWSSSATLCGRANYVTVLSGPIDAVGAVRVRGGRCAYVVNVCVGVCVYCVCVAARVQGLHEELP